MTTLTAIDPTGCGCTECLIGEYVPLDKATDTDIQRLFRGELRDNTDTRWTITEVGGLISRFSVSAGGTFVYLSEIVLPIPVDFYRLDVSSELVQRIWDNAPTLSD